MRDIDATTHSPPRPTSTDRALSDFLLSQKLYAAIVQVKRNVGALCDIRANARIASRYGRCGDPRKPSTSARAKKRRASSWHSCMGILPSLANLSPGNRRGTLVNLAAPLLKMSYATSVHRNDVIEEEKSALSASGRD